MNSSKLASFELPRYFRFYGFLFFMAGSFFHTIDLLGVENTVIWGMELTFFWFPCTVIIIVDPLCSSQKTLEISSLAKLHA